MHNWKYSTNKTRHVMDLQFRGHRHLDDVIARLEKRYGKSGKKTPQPSAAHFKKNQPPAIRRRIALQPAPTAVIDTGELRATVTTRRKRKRAPAMATLSAKEDRKRRMKKRHWYENKFGDLRKFVKKPQKKAKSRTKPPVCFNRRTTLLSLLKRIPAVKTPLAKMMG